MKIKKIGLLPRVIMAIIMGIAFGAFFTEDLVRVFVTFNTLFSEFLSFAVPLIIVGLVVPAIADLGTSAGKLLVITALIAYCSTVFSGFFTYFSCLWSLPHLIPLGLEWMTAGTSEVISLEPFFQIKFPPLLDVMSALLLSFLLGLGIAFSKGHHLHQIMNDFKNIIEKLIHHVIVPLLPLFIFGVFLAMSYSGQVWGLVSLFLRVIILIFILQALLLLFQFTVAGAIGRKNPFLLFKNMLPAYFTALGTSSSAATIPVTLDQTLKNGVRPDVANFVVPLCATIHLSGSTMKIVAFSMSLMMLNGMPVEFHVIAGFIFMLGLTMVAAPGVPGGAIVAALGLISSMLGFDESMQALMVALYIAIDSFGTACNVTGDGAIAVIVNRISMSKRIYKPAVTSGSDSSCNS